jgi:hypothetical protein
MINPTGTHVLNPFRARSNRQAISPGVSMGNLPGEYNADNARGMSHKAPMIVAGWGYDIFGRPVPSQAEKLSVLNPGSQTNSAYFGFANTSGIAVDPRGTPAPYGAEAPAEKYVGGAVDLRYNQRHGIWQTDHSFLAKITSISKQQPTEKNFYNIYDWEEVEVSKNAFGTDVTPIDRNLTHPAKGKAINLSELTTNVKDAVFTEVPIGTIIELKAHLAPAKDEDFTLKPIYVFNHQTNQNVFLRIDWNMDMGYPAPLSASDPQYTNSLVRMCNRFLYRAEVMYFDSTNTNTEAKYNSPFGGFSSFNPQIFVQAINLVEWGNPRGYRGMVSPGVLTLEAGTAVNCSTSNFDWAGCAVPANSKSAYPSGFAIRPISHNTIIEGKRLTGLNNSSITQYGPVYYFNIPNAHDGGCTTGIWPLNNSTLDSGVGELTVVKRTN